MDVNDIDVVLFYLSFVFIAQKTKHCLSSAVNLTAVKGETKRNSKSEVKPRRQQGGRGEINRAYRTAKEKTMTWKDNKTRRKRERQPKRERRKETESKKRERQQREERKRSQNEDEKKRDRKREKVNRKEREKIDEREKKIQRGKKVHERTTRGSGKRKK